MTHKIGITVITGGKELEMNKAITSFQILLPHIIKTAISVILLLIVWAIIVSLPMLGAIRTPLPFSLDELVGTVLLTVLVLVIINFSRILDGYLENIAPKFPQCGTIAKKVFLLISILILYHAYQPIIVPYLVYFGDLQWIYHVLFLVVFLIVLGTTTLLLYNNNENLAYLISGAKADGLIARAKIVCEACGNANDSCALYCSSCGSALPQPFKCNNCGKVLRSGDSFCMNCGTSRSEESEVENNERNDIC